MTAVCLGRLLMARKRAVVIKGTRDSIQWHTERSSRMRLRTSSLTGDFVFFVSGSSAVPFASCMSYLHLGVPSPRSPSSPYNFVQVNGTSFSPHSHRCLNCLSGNKAYLTVEETSPRAAFVYVCYLRENVLKTCLGTERGQKLPAHAHPLN